MARWTLAWWLVWSSVPCALAQSTSWRFLWRKGQVLDYRVVQETRVTEILGDSRQTTSAEHESRKRWQVLEVAGDGTATLQLTLTALRLEQVRPDGEKWRFDSADAAGSTPALRDALGKFLQQPLAVLRVDARGQVLAVLQNRGPVAFDAEPPFLLVLPPTPLSPGQSWSRTYSLVLPPPWGTGERYQAQQELLCQQVTPEQLLFRLKTVIPHLPANLLERIPLLQKQPIGEVCFDPRQGCMRRARLLTEYHLTDHQGPGSSYQFRSAYLEERVTP